MNDGQWTVLGLLMVLFALEAVRNKAIATWLHTSLITVSGAVSSK